ncbi:MAG: FIST C-terminal domain-containing protein [Alphaproteobacteria bacterium]|nr:FIST C-terminal domain-containing protein [Alphaproteobacteria bacterium]MBP9877674.1 FIST C-terminal domain-containing protein [Alphaproteobacteria bacterium]
MRISQGRWRNDQGLVLTEGEVNSSKVTLVLYFWSTDQETASTAYDDLRKQFPNAQIAGCSTGGEIIHDLILNDSVVYTAIEFEKGYVKMVVENFIQGSDCCQIGQNITKALDQEDLKGVFVLSDGLSVNGSELVSGFDALSKRKIPVTGGLAGDQDRFKQTWVSANGHPLSHQVVGIGFYGKDLSYHHGSYDGWEVFGPERIVTTSQGNVLYELDGKPALELYKKYLGPEADHLPASALLFPLAIWDGDKKDEMLVRTILSVNEEEQSMTFAGDIPTGYTAQLMWGKIDAIVEAAGRAAEKVSSIVLPEAQNQCSIVISCIGRKILMGQRVIQEVDTVSKVLGAKNKKIGFYSYGEIAPHALSDKCELHNKTMAITTFAEK